MSARVVLLHGFLGLPEDWQQVMAFLKTDLPPVCLDLNRLQSSTLSPPEAGKLIAEQILSEIPEEEMLLVGYSMGGRLLLEALPHLHERRTTAILVSTNLMPLQDDERDLRRTADKIWAKKFLQDAFLQVMTEWNSQEVFQGSVGEPDRKPSDYDRQVLANQMTNWSLANQYDLLQKAQIANALYIAGEKDLRYQKFIAQWGPGSGLEIKNAPQAGHRVLFDNPKYLAEIIGQRLAEL